MMLQRCSRTILNISSARTHSAIRHTNSKVFSSCSHPLEIMNDDASILPVEVCFMKDKGYKGLFTTVPNCADEVVLELRGTLSSTPTRESIYIGDGMHITDENGSFVNHSFTPTCYVDGKCLRALHDLPEHTEITFNYNENEPTMAAPFEIDGISVKGKQAASTL